MEFTSTLSDIGEVDLDKMDLKYIRFLTLPNSATMQRVIPSPGAGQCPPVVSAAAPYLQRSLAGHEATADRGACGYGRRQ